MSKTIVALDFSSKEQVIDFLNQFEEAGAVRYLIQMFAPLA